MKEKRTRRTPNALATPARVTSECKGPTPPYINTSKKHQSQKKKKLSVISYQDKTYDHLFNGLTISQIDLWRSTSSDTESTWLKKHSESIRNKLLSLVDATKTMSKSNSHHSEEQKFVAPTNQQKSAFYTETVLTDLQQCRTWAMEHINGLEEISLHLVEYTGTF